MSNQRGGQLEISTKELLEALANQHPYIARVTDNIPQAEEWFKDHFEVMDISQGKIFMRKSAEDALLCWKIHNDENFRERIMGEQSYSTADLYKGKMPLP